MHGFSAGRFVSSHNAQGLFCMSMNVCCLSSISQSVLEKLDDAAVVRECSLRMVQCKVLKRLELLAQKDLSHDPEMTDDLKFLQVSLPNKTDYQLPSRICVCE